MEIRPKTNVESAPRVYQNPGKTSRTVNAGADVSVFESSRALESRLKDIPDVRPEKVERAKHLIGDPSYPPRETIRKLSTLLAMSRAENLAEE